MKKLLGILVLGLLFCNTSFADINLWCRGDNEITSVMRDGEMIDRKREITGSYEVKVTDTHISFPKENKDFYPTVKRSKEIEQDKMYWGTNFFDRADPKKDSIDYTIDRIDGTLEIRINRYQMTIVTNLKCSTTKPKKLF